MRNLDETVIPRPQTSDLANSQAAALVGYQHRRLPADTELAQSITVLARAHQDATWRRTRAGNELRSGAMTCFFVRASTTGSPSELLRFDIDPRVETTAQAHRYLIHGGWWVPDTTGVLGELVRTTGQYRQITEDSAMEVAMRMAVDATAQSH
jgi:hypothetical protein